MKDKPIIIIAGEPYSIFSEILIKSLKKYSVKKPIIIIGSFNLIKNQINKLGYNFRPKKINFNNKIKNTKFNLSKINIIDVNFKYKKIFDKISKISNKYIFECFRLAIDISKKINVAGIINGPVSKKHLLDNKYPGITEFLAEKTNTKNYAMLIFDQNFSVSTITTHIPLKDVSKNISSKKIINHTKLINDFYKKYIQKKPRIAVTGLNPHCESNFLESEEKKFIIPALNKLKAKTNIKVSGPFANDSLFMKNNLKNFDVVIGMYHDQVLTPAKALNDFNAINITLGLPFVRISPDHGTNNQMIGKNSSNPQSLIQAIKFLDIKC